MKKMEKNYSFSNASKTEISFMINERGIRLNIKDTSNSDKDKNKINLPKNKIFHIKSLIFNEEKNCNETYNKYNCIYSEKDNILYLIFNENDNYYYFTKDKLINILEFSLCIGINEICLLISKLNPQFLNIIQDMAIVGFTPKKTVDKIIIDGNEYKILKMCVKDISQEIKEISFI